MGEHTFSHTHVPFVSEREGLRCTPVTVVVTWSQVVRCNDENDLIWYDSILAANAFTPIF
jgi:hypothetical protein